MALFSRVNKAAISPAPQKAAAAGALPGGYSPNSAGLGAAMVGQYYTYQEGDARNRAVSVPTINRARDLMASVIGCMPLVMYNEIWNGDEMEQVNDCATHLVTSTRSNCYVPIYYVVDI
jgi:hypothetical protein